MKKLNEITEENAKHICNLAGEPFKKCKEKACDGNVDLDKPVPIRTGCASFSIAYCCEKCGRLHWLGDKGVVRGVKNRQGKKAFVINGVFVNK